ncbi:MAG: hypothetical protein QOE34_2510 [Verrucomicrobiota bacterium]|jgi:mannose-6-phosphate isomerase-like protein (cupin superfamily)
MEKLNTKDITGYSWASPERKFVGAGKGISEELGRDPLSTHLKTRHLFDVKTARAANTLSLPPPSRAGRVLHVISGKGIVRHKDRITPIETGDAFIIPPDQPYQPGNDDTETLFPIW